MILKKTVLAISTATLLLLGVNVVNYKPELTQPAYAQQDPNLYDWSDLTEWHNNWVVRVGINGVCCFPFILDTGASDVTVSPDIFKAMIHDGMVTKTDIIDVQKYSTANGVMEGLRFKIHSLTVGNRTVHDVVGSVSEGNKVMLLGESFLRKFQYWGIDNARQKLMLGPIVE